MTGTVFSKRHERACAQASARLLELFPDAKASRRDKYPHAWRITLQSSRGNFFADLCLPSNFPSALPRIILDDGEKLWGVIPHVDPDGGLCVATNAAALKINSPRDAIDFIIKRAAEVLSNKSDHDFDAEFFSYWKNTYGESGNVLTLAGGNGIPATAHWISDAKRFIVSEDVAGLQTWCKRAGIDLKKASSGIENRVEISERIKPADFPNTLEQLLRLLDRHAPAKGIELRSHVTCSNHPKLLLFRFPTHDSVIDAAALIHGQEKHFRGRIAHGCRVGKVPWRIALLRSPKHTSDLEIFRLGVQSVHPAHLRVRGGSGVDFSDKKIAVIGCGSLGGYVAHMLARIGVGHITLIDNDTLSWDNAGRHILGGFQVGKNKAQALRFMLQMETPHIEIEALSHDIEDVLSVTPCKLHGLDLAISTIGVWAADYDLNFWGRKDDHSCPLMFSWLEPHGVAGHSMFVHPHIGGCLNCGCNEWGEFHNSVILPGTTQQIKGYGCGGFFQPYGVAEMLPTASMVVQHATDFLLGRCANSEIRTYIGPAHLFTQHHLTTREIWAQRIAENPQGSFERKPWAVNPECPHCR